MSDNLSHNTLVILKLRQVLIKVGLLLLNAENFINSDEKIFADFSFLKNFQSFPHSICSLLNFKLSSYLKLLLAVSLKVEDFEELVLENINFLFTVLMVSSVARSS